MSGAGDLPVRRLGGGAQARAVRESTAAGARGGELVPQLRPKALAKQLSGLVSGNGAEPVDAQMRLLAGKPRVIPAKPGVSFDQAEVDAAFLDLVARPEGERVMDVPAEVVEPAFTTKDAKALAITRGGLVVHDLLPLCRVPQRQHRPGRRAGGRDDREARVRRSPSTAPSASAPRRTASPGLRHQQRHLQGGLRRRRLADGDDDVQRGVLRRHDRRRAQAALVLHRPLPRRPRGDRCLADRRPAVAQRHAVRRPGPCPRHAQHRLVARAW